MKYVKKCTGKIHIVNRRAADMNRLFVFETNRTRFSVEL